jgi:PAS domain-containing protein
VQAGLAALGLMVIGGAILLLCGLALALRRARRLPAGGDSLLGTISQALGDAAFLLDSEGCVLDCNAVAAARFPGAGRRGRRIEELPGEQAVVLRRGIARGPAAGRIDLAGAGIGPAHAALAGP